MAARRRDLAGPLRLDLTDHIGEIELTVGMAARPIGDHLDRLDLRHRLTAEERDELGDRAHAEDLDPVDQLGFTGLTQGNDHSGETGLGSGQGGRQHAPDGPHPTVEAQLAQQRRAPQLHRREHVIRGQHRGDDGEVVMAAGLRQRGWAQIDRQQGDRPGLAGVADRGLASVPRLVERAVGQTDQHRTWQASPDVGLDLDHPAFEPDQGNGPSAGRCHQPTAFTWVRAGSWPGSSTTPIASSLIRSAAYWCSRIHSAAS